MEPVIIAYVIFCVLFAWINRNMIKAGKKINHAINGTIHIVVAGFIAYKLGIWAGVGSLFLARVVFDVSLNLFRGLSVDYVSINPKSVIDKIEKRIFKQDGITPKFICLFIWFVLNNIR